MLNRNIVVESRSVTPSVIEETVVSKYPSKMESVQTSFSQTVGQPQVEIRENVTAPVTLSSTVVSSVNGLGNPRIRYNQPKVINQSVVNVQETVEQVPVPVIPS